MRKRLVRIEIVSLDGYAYFESRSMRCLGPCQHYEGCQNSHLKLCGHLPEKKDKRSENNAHANEGVG